MTDIEYLRKHCPPQVPFAVRELVLANVVVGNFTTVYAADLLGAWAVKNPDQQQDCGAN